MQGHKCFLKKRTLYLLLLLVIGLFSCIVVPTYAKFTSNYTTPEEVVGFQLNFDLAISNIEEYEEVVVAPFGKEIFQVEIENSMSQLIYYGVWYKMVEPKELNDKIVIARSERSTISTSGSIDVEGKVVVQLVVINDSDSEVKLNIGVASSETDVSDIEYLDGKHLISGTADIPTAAMYIKNLYQDGSEIKEVAISLEENKGNVLLNEKQGIMYNNFSEYRYYGQNPNNYVWFNRELWRIISVSEEKINANDTVSSTRVKLIREESLGNYAYDALEKVVDEKQDVSDLKKNLVNDWKNSILNSELHTFYFNRQVGDCFVQDNGKDICDFSNIGLDATARDMIGDTLFFLGALPNKDEGSFFVNDIHVLERGSQVYDCSTDDGSCPRSITWSGSIGLMYPSDYGYATDFNLCHESLIDYQKSTYDSDLCLKNNWLFNSRMGEGFEWTMTPFMDATKLVGIGTNGNISPQLVSQVGSVRPVVYLNSNVSIVGGMGTRDNPYQLQVGF